MCRNDAKKVGFGVTKKNPKSLTFVSLSRHMKTNERKKTILLIEDDLSLLDNTREILELNGYEVLTASSAKKGVETLARSKPDLILCDIQMPGPKGHVVLHYAKLSPENADIPFLFFSAQTEQKDIADAMEAGADDYLQKPFLIPELLEILEKHVKKSTKTFFKQKSRDKAIALASLTQDPKSLIKQATGLFEQKHLASIG